jgi:hypothetical protein
LDCGPRKEDGERVSDKIEVRVMATKSGEYIVLVKGKSGTLIVLTPEEAVGIANELLNVAQSVQQATSRQDDGLPKA